jgi:hypothetical protein
MSKDDATPAKTTNQPVNVDAMIARLPAMSDADLATLHANATRLKEGGTNAQRAGATALLPAIEAERAKRPPPTRPKPPGRKAKAKAPAKVADETPELE